MQFLSERNMIDKVPCQMKKALKAALYITFIK